MAVCIEMEELVIILAKSAGLPELDSHLAETAENLNPCLHSRCH